jgi:site-specific DNA-methyltransferase (adenine-specific)
MTNKYTIHHGDCIDFLATLEDNSVDCLLTDPPYASGGNLKSMATGLKYGGIRRKGARGSDYQDFLGDNHDDLTHLNWMRMVLNEAFRVLKDGAPIFIFSDWKQYHLTSQAIQIANLIWRGAIVWHRTANNRPYAGFRNRCEFILYGSKKKWKITKYNEGFIECHSLSYQSGNKLHMTEKPLPVLKHLLDILEDGSVVLDPFMGSGSTGDACIKLGHKFIGAEISEHYFNVAKKRLEKVQNEVLF